MLAKYNIEVGQLRQQTKKLENHLNLSSYKCTASTYICDNCLKKGDVKIAKNPIQNNKYLIKLLSDGI